METNFLTISIIVLIAFASVSYYIIKIRGYEKEIKKDKLIYYKNFLDIASAIPREKIENIETKEFAQALNSLFLIASSEVVTAINNFVQSIEKNNEKEKVDNFSKLIFEIHRDIYNLHLPGYDCQSLMDCQPVTK